MNLFGDEKNRRKLDTSFDAEPSMNHRRNYSFFRKYIKDKKILDIGCWTGQFEQLILKDAKEVVAIDPGKEAIQYAKKRLPKVKFITGTLDTVALQKNSFDVVLLLDVIEHLPENTEVETLKKIYSLLKQKGYLIITTPNNHLLSVLLDPAFYLIGHRHYSKNKLKNMLYESNFSVEKIFTYGNLAMLLDGILDVIEKYIIHRKISVRKIIQRKAIENNDSGFVSVCVIAKSNCSMIKCGK